MSDVRDTGTGAAKVPPQSRGQEEMSSSAQVPTPALAPQSHAEAPTGASGWVGMVGFAAILMIMVGAFQVILGLTALFNSGYYVVGQDALLVSVDFTGWGLAHIALGAVAVAAAIGLLAGQMWARVVGIAMALVSAIVNMVFIAAYPLWSIAVITLDVLIIYAIATHGKELKAD